ncbi:inactive tyrosine-protein kinase PEAK1-like [Brachyistius frenatus]|uniref:inactive tyrosine-protein kinase PEAK1-like n=1 Tax=Brachyistius frenatus TaxID=100188 RepID=UPI0037E8CC70
MASGCGSRVEEQPPALPVKQHRRSSVESDFLMLSPVGLCRRNSACDDVFAEPTDCHAAQCPIHQRYDSSRHQERFFSDGVPPPVPKKRLARTLSLPGTNAPPLSPLSPFSPLRRHPQNFDNPLYMMAPIRDTYICEEAEEVKPARRSPVPLFSFSQLSFDTPDEHLAHLFSSFVDQRAVSQGMQHCQLLFLRSMAQNVEARNLLQGEGADGNVRSYQLQDFRLCDGSKPKQIGNMTYYSLHSPEFPGRVLGLRVHKHTEEASSVHNKHQLSHVNVQHRVAYFRPCRILKNNTSTLQTQDPTAASIPSKSDYGPAKPPGGSTEHATVPTSAPTVQLFLHRGHCVSVERDLPHATLQDFVEDSRSLKSTQRLDYDRQVCVLLLQILTGSHHLYNNNATAAELRPQEILLVWPSRARYQGGHELREDASEEKAEEREWEETEDKGRIQTLWRTRGSPRVVLVPQSSALSEPQSLSSVKFQIGAVIQFCLKAQASPGSTAPVSSYRRGLLHLSSVIQSDSAPQMTDTVAMLQVLLWGPRAPLPTPTGSTAAAVHNWLTTRRALLVMKLAERGLIRDHFVLDWEDYMRMQYLSFTDSETVANVSSQLWRTLNT